MDASFVQILSSDRVSSQTRQVLEERGRVAEREYAFFSAEEAAVLEALAEAVLPQGAAGTAVPCGKMIDQRLSRREGSGWRYDSLPEDGAAYRVALRTVAGEGGVDEALLGRLAGGTMDTPEFAMSRWFEGFKWEVVKCWLAHPETMSRMRYDGFADEQSTALDVAPQSLREGGR